MTIQLEDPRLTAHALGELESDSDRAEVEAFLSRSEEARKLVEDIRETAALLRDALDAEPAAGLSPERREAIAARLQTKPAGRHRFWAGAAIAATAAAATAVLTLFLYPAYQGEAPATSPPAVIPDVADRVSDASPVSRGPKPLEAPAPLPAPSEAPAPAPAANALRQELTPMSPPRFGIPARSPSPDADAEYGVTGGIEGGVPGGVAGGTVGGVAPSEPAPADELRILGYVSPPPPARPSYPRTVGEDARRRENPANFPYDRTFRDIQKARPPFHTEAYDRFDDNPFLDVSQDPLSTFSIDVDTASFANLRRFISRSTLPPKDAVRIEELVNYFDYDYPPPPEDQPFSVHVEIADAPWKGDHRLMRIGLKGMPLTLEDRPPLNLVFLLDVSGSMQPPNKLPLLQKAMRLLVDRLREDDQIAIVVYAGASGLVLPRTSGDQKEGILYALDRLRAGGSTNGGAGIQLAYDQALAQFVPGGVNRVILATDGDFNVGVTAQGELTRLIEERAASGVFLSVLGFGMGNYKDSTLEKLADRGNGNYAYIDSLPEARKVLVREMGATLVTIAKDVKIQIEFNPNEVQSYRLIGYENRMLRAQDFNDDRKDAGEIGAGHTVTALYEIVPAGSGTRSGLEVPGVDPLKYQRPQAATDRAASDELLTVKLRYKKPDGDRSALIEQPVKDEGRSYAQASEDFKFAAAVASYGMILRQSPHKGNATIDATIELAQEGLGRDRHGYRTAFVELVKRTKPLLEK